MPLSDSLVSVVLLCCIIEPVILVTYPCQLKIFLEGNEINNTDICIGEYTSLECRPFVSSFNRPDLPPGYPNESLSIERPSYIDLVGLKSLYKPTNEIYPGLSIKWAPPVSEAAKRDLEGFLIVWRAKDTNYCRLFEFKQKAIQDKTKLTFSYDIERLIPASNYSVIVYSTPPPKPGDQNNEKVFMRMTHTTFTQYSAERFEPGLWTPSVSVKTWNNGSVDVKFTLSPPEFNLTLFQVLLLKKSDWTNYFMMINYTGTVYSKENPEGIVTFSNVPTDEYYVLVRPKDPYPYDVNQCLCWKKDTDKYCEASCASIFTDYFLVNVTEEPTTPTPSTTPMPSITPAPPSTAAPGGGLTSENVAVNVPADDKMAWIIGGTSVGGFLLIVILCLGFCFYSSSTKSFSLTKAKQYFHRVCLDDGKSKYSMSPSPVVPEISNAAPFLTKRTMYILSADTHEAHINMIKSFAEFLEVHCHCQVIYPPLEVDHDNVPCVWFVRSMTKTERIIFVDSEGAEKLVQAHVENKTYKNREISPQIDLFTMCLKCIFNDANVRSNLLLVHFDKERSQKLLLYPPSFQLPKQLPKFLRHVHGFSHKNDTSYASYLPMCTENIQALPQGAKLLTAIELSKSFERVNPNWSESYFGVASPELMSMPSISGDSGFDEIHGSVSSQDIRQLDTGSPTSPTTLQPFFGPGQNGNHDKDPELSIFTIPIDHESVYLNSALAHPVNLCPIIPPTSPSEFVDSFSHYVDNINRECEYGSVYEPDQPSTVKECCEGLFIIPNRLEDFQKTIHPPESPSEEDNTSSALREFNFKYDNSLC